MKELMLIIAMAICMSSCMTKKLISINEVSKVINVKGSKTELYIKASTWMVETFSDAKSVIQFSDKESGTVMGKYLLKNTTTVFRDFDGHPTTFGEEIYVIIKILIIDNSVKIIVIPKNSWIVYEDSGIENLNYSSNQAYSDIRNIINSFKYYMNNSNNSF